MASIQTIQSLDLECGMPLVVEDIPGVRSVGISWLLPCGSATDGEDRQGLAAMWHELVHRGAGDLDSRAQADAFDRLGATRGAEVGTFHLGLSFTLLGSRLIQALGPIADMVIRPRCDAESIEPTRELCRQALASLADEPQERAVLLARQLHNPSPINRSSLGTDEGLSALTRDDILQGWQVRATPRPPKGRGGRAILAIAGSVGECGGATRIASELNRLLKVWPRQSGAGVEVEWGESPTRGRYRHETDESSQVQVVVMHDSPPEPSPDAVLERIVNSVLSGGMSCRLFTEVREKRGLCYSVSQSYATDRFYGRSLAYVGTTPERAQQSLDVLVEQLRAICGRSVGGGGRLIERDEFDRAMVGVKSRLVFSGESTSARAGALAGDMHRLGRARSLTDIARTYDQVTLDAVNDYLERRRIGDMTVVTLGPGEGLKWG